MDPIGDPDWVCSVRFDDIESAIEYLQSTRDCFVFVDECGEYFEEGQNKDYAWLATRSRHFGHSMFFISQRLVQVPRTMRDQCQRLYLFTSALSDGKIHAEEWNKPVLENCHQLPKFHFFACSRYESAKYYRIVDYSKVEIIPNGFHTTDTNDNDASIVGINNNKRRKVDRKNGAK